MILITQTIRLIGIDISAIQCAMSAYAFCYNTGVVVRLLDEPGDNNHKARATRLCAKVPVQGFPVFKGFTFCILETPKGVLWQTVDT